MRYVVGDDAKEYYVRPSVELHGTIATACKVIREHGHSHDPRWIETVAGWRDWLRRYPRCALRDGDECRWMTTRGRCSRPCHPGECIEAHPEWRYDRRHFAEIGHWPRGKFDAYVKADLAYTDGLHASVDRMRRWKERPRIVRWMFRKPTEGDYPKGPRLQDYFPGMFPEDDIHAETGVEKLEE